MRLDLRRALLATGMLVALSGFALAHDPHARDGSDVAQRANQQGYSDGFQHGREDRDRSAGYDYHGDDYQRADRGYDPNYGDRDQFTSAYREGYRAGYDDGYNGRSAHFDDTYDPGRDDRYGRDHRFGRGDGYRDSAYDTGYRDGIEGAQKDIRKNKRFDLNDHDWYKKANHGYSRSYGDKEAYRQQYRQGYEAGYRDAFEPAYANGYRDGILGARKDRHKHKSPDPTRHDGYRDPDRGYNGSYYGSREDYRQRYREGYVAGYNDGYNGLGY